MTNEEKTMTGYPSKDKPWLKYYSDVVKKIELPVCSLYEYLYDCNKDNLSSIALNYFGNRITYEDLFSDIDKVAAGFVRAGVERGDIVTIVSVSNVVSIICLYALNRIGAVANYVNVLADEEDFIQYFKEASSKIVVTLDLFGDKVTKAALKTNVEQVISFSLSEYMPLLAQIGYKTKVRNMDFSFLHNSCVIRWDNFIKGARPLGKLINKNPNEPCLLGHTGGTTGFPKGVFLSDFAMNAVTHQYKLTMDHTTGETFLNCIIPFVVYGILTCLHMPLCLGLEVIVVPKFEASDWKKYIKKNRPVHIAGIPSYVIPMLTDESLKDIDLSFIKTLAVGGDGLNDQLENQINCFLNQHGANITLTKGYGMTEVCATAVTEYSFCNRVGSVGIPMVKNNIMIYDHETKTEATYNVVGEVCINSPSLMIGYQNNLEGYEQLVQVHADGVKWVHTGDLGYITEAGFLYISGRMKRMIFLGPEGMLYKVFPKNIEDVINRVNDIKESCVVSKKADGKLVARAYIVLGKSSQSISDLRDKIINECKSKMPEYMIPQEIIVLDAMPLTTVGKVDFKCLEVMAENS